MPEYIDLGLVIDETVDPLQTVASEWFDALTWARGLLLQFENNISTLQFAVEVRNKEGIVSSFVTGQYGANETPTFQSVAAAYGLGFSFRITVTNMDIDADPVPTKVYLQVVG